MSSDLSPGPDSPPADELASAEAALVVLQQVLRTMTRADSPLPTPCPEFTVRELIEHLLHSTMVLGHMAGARITVHEDTESIEDLVTAVARPALDAWREHGLEGDVALAEGSMRARTAVAVFSIEFLVHGWDFATAVGQEYTVPEPLANYVLRLAARTIKLHERRQAGFGDLVGLPPDSSSLHRLLGFTGRNPLV